MTLLEIIRKAAGLEGLSEEERKILFEFNPEVLTGQLEEISQERDGAKKELGDYIYRNQVLKLAEKHHFADSGYLEFLCRQKGVSLEDETSVNSYMEELKSSSPKLFRLPLKPGGGVVDSGREVKGVVKPGMEHDIITLLANAPEVN